MLSRFLRTAAATQFLHDGFSNVADASEVERKLEWVDIKSTTKIEVGSDGNTAGNVGVASSGDFELTEKLGVQVLSFARGEIVGGPRNAFIVQGLKKRLDGTGFYNPVEPYNNKRDVT